jgi:hypothetical protein
MANPYDKEIIDTPHLKFPEALKKSLLLLTAKK